MNHSAFSANFNIQSKGKNHEGICGKILAFTWRFNVKQRSPPWPPSPIHKHIIYYTQNTVTHFVSLTAFFFSYEPKFKII